MNDLYFICINDHIFTEIYLLPTLLVMVRTLYIAYVAKTNTQTLTKLTKPGFQL